MMHSRRRARARAQIMKMKAGELKYEEMGLMAKRALSKGLKHNPAAIKSKSGAAEDKNKAKEAEKPAE